MSSFCELCRSGDFPEIPLTCNADDCIYHAGNEKYREMYENRKEENHENVYKRYGRQ